MSATIRLLLLLFLPLAFANGCLSKDREFNPGAPFSGARFVAGRATFWLNDTATVGDVVNFAPFGTLRPGATSDDLEAFCGNATLSYREGRTTWKACHTASGDVEVGEVIAGSNEDTNLGWTLRYKPSTGALESVFRPSLLRHLSESGRLREISVQPPQGKPGHVFWAWLDHGRLRSVEWYTVPRQKK